MKAAIYMGKENVEIRELPKPVCGEDDVLIQNIYSSICGTDVAVYKHGPNTGHRITVGGEFGHETVSSGSGREKCHGIHGGRKSISLSSFGKKRHKKGGNDRIGRCGGASIFWRPERNGL